MSIEVWCLMAVVVVCGSGSCTSHGFGDSCSYAYVFGGSSKCEMPAHVKYKARGMSTEETHKNTAIRITITTSMRHATTKATNNYHSHKTPNFY